MPLKWITRITIERGLIMSEMHSPPHPGAILADTVLGQESGKSVSAFADQLGISRVTLSRVVNGRAAVSVDMALALAEATDTSPESWLNMQTAYDLWQARVARRKMRASSKPNRVRTIRETAPTERQRVPSRIPERPRVGGWDTAAGMVAFNRIRSPRRTRVAAARKKK
jgi:antitoxin HigA-1